MRNETIPEMTRLGKYELRRVLGKGAMGVVYEGFDTVIERRVAIKTVHKALLEGDGGQELLLRFKREAQAAGQLMHQNIVAVHEYDEDHGTPFIVMEFVPGITLDNYIKQKSRFDLQKINDMMSQALHAMSYVHGHGVIHRDMKPANIILLDDGQIKVADFGIARIDSSTMTQLGSVMGTPSYMSPEQFMGQSVDKRTDLFSMGVILFELLTGEKPFPGEGMVTIMQKVLYAPPDDPTILNFNLPKPFQQVIQKALAKRPEERFQSAQEFLVALRLATENKLFQPGELDLSTESTWMEKTSLLSSTPPAPNATAAKPAEPNKGKGNGVLVVAWVGIAVLVTVALGGAAWWFLHREPPVASPVPVTALAPIAQSPASVPAAQPAASVPAAQPAASVPAAQPAASVPAAQPATSIPPPRETASTLPIESSKQPEPSQSAAPITVRLVASNEKAGIGYKKGDNLVLTLSLSLPGYPYCYYRDGEGIIAQIYPNRFQSDKRLWDGQTITIPPPGKAGAKPKFFLTFSKSGVEEEFFCLASHTEIDYLLPKEWQVKALTPIPALSLDEIAQFLMEAGNKTDAVQPGIQRLKIYVR